MLIRLAQDSPATFTEQIAAQIRLGVADGSIAQGERLPTARELGASLGVNMHTVLRAYDALRSAGVIDVRRGRGAVVIGGDRPAERAVLASAVALVAEARRAGVTDVASVVRGMV